MSKRGAREGAFESKRSAREVALQVLFEVDLSSAEAGPALLRALLRAQEKETEVGVALIPEEEKEYARILIDGVVTYAVELDKHLGALAKGWEVARMPGVDRNLMRIAIYEIEHQHVPVGLAINEAVELAKKYSTEDSGRFVNGVLAGYLKARTAAAAAPAAAETTPAP